MASSWRLLLDLDGRPGWQNMALDQALLARAGRGERWLRLYRWAPHCLSFGRHEPALRRYDRARIEARGLDAVRRPTGGRAVWHAEELTYALAAPAEPFGGLRQAYEEIHRMLLAALRRLGVSRRSRRRALRFRWTLDRASRRRSEGRSRSEAASWWAAPSSEREPGSCSTAPCFSQARRLPSGR